MKNKLITTILSSAILLPSFAATTTSTTTKKTYVQINDSTTYVSDRAIRESVDAMIDARPELDDDVSFRVKDGVVTLTGKVDNNSEITEAINVTKQVRGVNFVVNKLVSERAGLESVPNYQETTRTEEVHIKKTTI